MAEVTNNLQRIRELAVQSANSTNTSSDRTSLNAEVVQLLAEIQRVATTSQFNGQNILDGTFTAAQFQVGANANQTITASTGNSQTSAIGSYQVTSGSTAVSGTALSVGSLTLNGADVGSSTSGSAEAIASAINGITSTTGVTASASTTLTSAVGNTVLRNQALQSGDLVINGVSIGAVAGSSNVATQGANVAAAINAVSNQTGVTAVVNGGSGALTLTSSTGKTIELTTNAATTADGATRVENATGLEMAGATTAKTFGTSTLTVASGVLQVVTSTSTSTALASDTLSIAGVTFTYSTGGNSSTNIQIAADGLSATQAANVASALSANSTVLNAFAITSTVGAVVTLTAKSNVKSTAVSDGLAQASSTTNASTWGQTTAGAGVALGDTLKVGGLTYEFTASWATAAATSGNIQVKLGSSGVSATNDAATATNLAAAISAQQALGNGTVGLTSNSGAGVLVVTNTLYGSAGVVAAPTEPVTLGTTGAIVATNTVGVSGNFTANSQKGTLTLNSASTFTIGGNSPATAGLSGASVGLNTISNVSILTVDGANNAISLIDGALSQVSTIRGSMGALQNRFTSVVASLTASSENLSAARSRIQDADYAAETAQLTRNQILQQAGTAMLAQANQLPNSVLTLLR